MEVTSRKKNDLKYLFFIFFLFFYVASIYFITKVDQYVISFNILAITLHQAHDVKINLNFRYCYLQLSILFAT